MNEVYLIYNKEKLVGVVERVESVTPELVLQNFMGSCGIDPATASKANWRVDSAPLIAWKSLAYIWEPIPR